MRLCKEQYEKSLEIVQVKHAEDLREIEAQYELLLRAEKEEAAYSMKLYKDSQSIRN